MGKKIITSIKISLETINIIKCFDRSGKRKFTRGLEDIAKFLSCSLTNNADEKIIKFPTKNSEEGKSDKIE